MAADAHVLRFRYGKVGAGRYISHLDTIRAAERAIRKMALPVLYSEGFSPRPRMSFAAALPVGISSKAEHMDVFLAREVDPKEALELGVRAFPEAMPLLAAGSFAGGYALPARIRRAKYSIRPFDPEEPGWTCGQLEEAVMAFTAATSAAIAGKDGKSKETKDLVFGIKVMDGALEAEVACGDRNLRPQELMMAISLVMGGVYAGAYDFSRTALLIDLGRGPQEPLADCVDVARSLQFRS